MKIELKEKPKNPVIIEAFPGFGMVGTIAAEFLIDHLKARQIGRLYSEAIPPVIAVHQGKVIEPFSIFYDKTNNLVILSALGVMPGVEWELSEAVLKLYETLKAKEIISIEGVESNSTEEPKTFFLTSDSRKQKKLAGIGLKELNDGVILGVSAALLIKSPESAYIFAETHSELPDSRAAAKIVETLDRYIGLKVDYKPLIKKADEFEKKLKELLGRAMQQQKEKRQSYLG